MSDSTQFWLKFSGPGTEVEVRDFYDLRASVIALRDLLEEGSRVVVGKNRSVYMKVQADFNTASFKIWFELSEGPSKETSDTANILSLLGIGGPEGIGLLWLIKRLKGEIPKKTTKIDQTDLVEIETIDGAVAVPKKVVALLNHPPIRRAAERLVRPLKQPGITQIRLGRLDEHGQTTAITIEKQELTYFEAPLSH